MEKAGEKIEEAKKKWYRAKYFRFIENRRPPFYGTWRKSSKLIGPRTPFGRDTVSILYELSDQNCSNRVSRNFSTMKLTPMMNGRRKNLESLCTDLMTKRTKMNLKMMTTILTISGWFHTGT